MLAFDYRNCLSEAVKQHGVSPDDLAGALRRYPEVHKTVVLKARNPELPLGFIRLPFDREGLPDILALARRTRNRFDTFVVAGIGGSALGNLALQGALRDRYWNLRSLKERGGRPRLFVLDNIDPESMKSFLETVDLRRTMINVISKAGTTAECLAVFFVIWQKLQKAVGAKKARSHVVLTTDKEKGFLRELANEGFCEESFVIPRNVGGRFSVLSPVGLVSAACSGINVRALLDGAQEAAERFRVQDEAVSSEPSPAYLFAALNWLLYRQGKTMCVMMPYADALYGMADWFRQLWAESLGKEKDNAGNIVNVGPTPIKALGATDQHSQVQLYREGPNDKVVVFLSVEKYRAAVRIPPFKGHYLSGHTLNELIRAEERATRVALTRSQRPNMTIRFPRIDERSVGEFIFMMELATAYAGELFNINAFNQPGVELAKNYTYALLGRDGYQNYLEELNAFPE
jgi:glucose-6-phosphate isomerase